MLCGEVGGISDHAFAAHPIASPVSYPVAQLPRHQSSDIPCTAPDSREPQPLSADSNYLPRVSSCLCIAIRRNVVLQEVSPAIEI